MGKLSISTTRVYIFLQPPLTHLVQRRYGCTSLGSEALQIGYSRAIYYIAHRRLAPIYVSEEATSNVESFDQFFASSSPR